MVVPLTGMDKVELHPVVCVCVCVCVCECVCVCVRVRTHMHWGGSFFTPVKLLRRPIKGMKQ